MNRDSPKPGENALVQALAQQRKGLEQLWPYLPSDPLPPFQSPIANALAEQQAKTKRKVYFAFDFEDIMRVNNVRNAWKITHPSADGARNFYDRSIWTESRAHTDEGLKKLMTAGVKYSSAVCVLVGLDTWRSRWVKYEIARAVIDERGLVAVHVNGLAHAQRQLPDPLGFNPLRLMGIYHAEFGRYVLYEQRVFIMNTQTGDLGWQWVPYEDFKANVPLPRTMVAIPVGHLRPLSEFAGEYDYVAQLGHKNIRAWIDGAASAVGR